MATATATESDALVLHYNEPLGPQDRGMKSLDQMLRYDYTKNRTSVQLMTAWGNQMLSHLPVIMTDPVTYKRTRYESPLAAFEPHLKRYDGPIRQIGKDMQGFLRDWTKDLGSVFQMRNFDTCELFRGMTSVLRQYDRAIHYQVHSNPVLIDMMFRFVRGWLACVNAANWFATTENIQSARRNAAEEIWGCFLLCTSDQPAGYHHPLTRGTGQMWARRQYRHHFRTQAIGQDADHQDRWRTSDVVALAHGIIESMDSSRMSILADALMDAGCENEYMLHYCRRFPEDVPPTNWLTVWAAGTVS